MALLGSNFLKLNKILQTIKPSIRLINGIKTSTTCYETPAAAAAATAGTAIPPPNIEGQPKVYSQKVQKLVNEIANLTLIEVSDLNELLRKTLNIKDVPVYSAAPVAGGGGGAAVKKEEEEESVQMPTTQKSSFKLKIVKFDEGKKVALIKEIKGLTENMNLVQAKKFIESVPQVFRDNVSKDEAEKLKAQLEKAGAVCEID